MCVWGGEVSRTFLWEPPPAVTPPGTEVPCRVLACLRNLVGGRLTAGWNTQPDARVGGRGRSRWLRLCALPGTRPTREFANKDPRSRPAFTVLFVSRAHSEGTAACALRESWHWVGTEPPVPSSTRHESQRPQPHRASTSSSVKWAVVLTCPLRGSWRGCTESHVGGVSVLRWSRF